MAKNQKSQTEQLPATVEQNQDLIELKPTDLKPASLVGVRNELTIPQSALPEEFQGTQLETLDTTLPPTVKWFKPGEYVAGVYEGVEIEVGPNKSKLYNFDARGKKFSIWGTATLDRVFASGQIHPGDLLLITYIGEIPTDLNPCKMFDIKKAGVKKA